MLNVRTSKDESSSYDWFRSSWNVVATAGTDRAVWQTARKRGGCLFVETLIRGCRGHRGDGEIRQSDENGLYVTVYDAGGLDFRTGRQQSTLQAGDILLWDTALPGSFDCQKSASGRTILFPRTMVDRRLGTTAGLSGLRSDRRNPLTAVLRSHLLELHRLSGVQNVGALDDLLETSLELTLLCMSGTEDKTHDRRGAAAAFAAVRGYLRAHPTTAGLSPSSVARELGMSCRNLQAVLASHGTTFTKLLAGERMRRAVKLLRSSAPVSEIALSLGYFDQAHFSNAFRRHYGVTPGHYRTRR